MTSLGVTPHAPLLHAGLPKDFCQPMQKHYPLLTISKNDAKAISKSPWSDFAKRHRAPLKGKARGQAAGTTILPTFSAKISYFLCKSVGFAIRSAFARRTV